MRRSVAVKHKTCRHCVVWCEVDRASVPAGAAHRMVCSGGTARRGQGRAGFCAAKRTLDAEHCSGIPTCVDGRRSGNTFLLVSFELRVVYAISICSATLLPFALLVVM